MLISQSHHCADNIVTCTLNVILSVFSCCLGFSVAQRACIMTGMGTADEQMAVRAQRALIRRVTSHLHFSPSTPVHAGTAAGRALRATIECSRGTTSDKEDVEDEGDMPPQLEGDDDEDEVTSCVADCAAAVRRERVESGTPMIPVRSSAPSGIPLKAAPHKSGKFLVTVKVQPSPPQPDADILFLTVTCYRSTCRHTCYPQGSLPYAPI
jgi:hypothetical protein